MTLNIAEYWLCTDAIDPVSWKSNYRVAMREFLTALSVSTIAPIARPEDNKKRKVIKINLHSVMYETFHPLRAKRMASAMHAGVIFPPILVEEKVFQHLRYYVVLDGNHRAAAAAYLCETKIKAQVVSSTDLTGIDFTLDNKNILLVESKHADYKYTGLKIETEVMNIVYNTFKNFKDYSIIKEAVEHGTQA